MSRDELARSLYIHEPDECGGWVSKDRQCVSAEEWDTNRADAERVADCYAQADRMIRDGEAPR